jgi:polyisoprenoid-binding protein YceI
MGTAYRLIPVKQIPLGIRFCKFGLGIFALLSVCAASGQELVLRLDPAQSSIKFTLGAALHTVHGSFQIQTADLQVNPAVGRLSGEVVVNAESGETGNGMRDRKMHREVLESQRYSEITFRPDRVDGGVAEHRKSSVKVHGIFTVHGSEHEITVPADVDLAGDRWSAAAHFTIPYVKWGMQNPSTFFLHVGDEVEIDVAMVGTLTREAPASAPAQ